ncbi:MAG TPA: hydantoinase/oxoprolinase family protein, partial [Chloroflexota bacterium]
TAELDAAALERAFGELEQVVTDGLAREGRVEVRRTIDMRYAGQSFELSLPVPAPLEASAVAELDERFAMEHERTYGHRAVGDPVEVVHIRVQGYVAAVKRAPVAILPQSSITETRPAYFGPSHGLVQTPVVARSGLSEELRGGPLIVEEYDATSVIPPGWSIRRDPHNNLIITLDRAL